MGRLSGARRATRWVLPALLLLGGSAGLAQTPPIENFQPRTTGILQIEPHINLPGVTLRELLPNGSSAISLGNYTGAPGAFAGTGVSTQIVRRLPVVWRLRLPDAQASAIDVQYEISGPDGRPGRLVADGGTPSEVRVQLREIPPLVVSQEIDGAVVEGGLVLYLDLESVRTAGRYSGTLTVTLNQL